ncbi:MAG TPA: hypothetical protein VHW60_08795 [Caulobacteraceae bacterium]|nr:hypothetical protein [Caulobacteraceae bacterium]
MARFFVVSFIVRPATERANPSKLSIPRASISFCGMAVIAAGACCSDSSRRLAVTMMSLTVDTDVSGAAGSARTGPASAKVSPTAPTSSRVFNGSARMNFPQVALAAASCTNV